LANPIVLLSGPVGAGKTTVVRELVNLWPGRALACIEGDTFWGFFAKSDARGPTYPKFKTMMQAMVAAAVQFAERSPVIVDFSIPPWFLEDARRIAEIDSVPLDYVVLRPSEGVCAQRAATRSSGAIEDYAPYRELYRDFDAATAHMVGDDTTAANEVAHRILRGVESGDFRVR